MKKTGFLLISMMIILSVVLSGCGSSKSSAETGNTSDGSNSTGTAASGNDTSNNNSGNNSNTVGGSASNNATSSKPVDLQFLYPVSVGGPIAKTIQGYVDTFNKQNDGKIHVNAVFSGNYTQTSTKVKTEIGAHKAPDLAIMLQTDIYDLTDLGYVQSLDSYIKQSGDSYINDFYPALLKGSEVDGHRYSLPFQRSIQVLYYNKDLFKAAGIQNPPETWDALIKDGGKLTKTKNGKTTTWGLQESIGGPMSYWGFQPFALENGVTLASADGKKVKFDDPKTVEALKFFNDLATVHHIMPKGQQAWGDIPTNFLAQRAAMVIYTTGGLTSIKNKASFNFGVAMLPTNGGLRTNLGGGNIYMMKDIPQSHKDAAWKFIQYMTSPKMAANWSIASGYIAERKSAYDNQKMKDYLKSFPQAVVARDEMKYAGAELTTHNEGKVTVDMSDEITAVIEGQKTPAAAMKAAQQKAERDLKGF